MKQYVYQRSQRWYYATGIASIMFVLLAFAATRIFIQPSLGAEWDERGTIWYVQPGLPLAVNDHILAIDGVPLVDSPFPYYNWQPGDTIILDVQRDDVIYTVALDYSKPTTWTIKALNLALILVAFAFWIAGVAVVQLASPSTRPSWLFFIACMLISGSLAGGIPTTYGWLSHVAKALTWWAIAVFLHFHLVFPQSKLRLTRFVVPSLYLVPILGTARELQSMGAIRLPPLADRVFPVAFEIWIVFGVMSILALLMYSYWTDRTHASRRQIGVVLAMCLVAIIPVLTLHSIPILLLGRAFVRTSATFPFLLAIPLGYSYAIVQYKLIKVERYISRSATVVFVFGVLTIMYIIATLGLTTWQPASIDAPLTNLVIVITLVAAFNPIRQRLQNLSDQLLYGGWYDYSSVVGALTYHLDETRSNVAELAETFCNTIQRTMRVHYVAVLLPEEQTDAFIVHEAGPSFAASPMGNVNQADLTQIKALLLTHNAPADTYTINEQIDKRLLSPVEKQLLSALEPRLWLPISGRNQSTGLLILGTKLGGDLFDESDLEILQVVAKQIGVAFQNYQLVIELERKASENVRYRRELMRAREEERKRLARELHDELIQQLVGLKYQFASFQSVALANGAKDPSIQLFGQLEHEFVCLIQVTRTICHDLRPPALDLGMIPAIRSVLGRFERDYGLDIALNISGERPETIREDIELCVFRCTSEALVNIWKHANASLVKVSLVFRPMHLEWAIEDDGCGFDVPEHLGALMERNHFGLVSMRERIELINGQFKIDSGPVGGTRLSANIPV
jgi:signal transduction histidine kinase